MAKKKSAAQEPDRAPVPEDENPDAEAAAQEPEAAAQESDRAPVPEDENPDAGLEETADPAITAAPSETAKLTGLTAGENVLAPGTGLKPPSTRHDPKKNRSLE